MADRTGTDYPENGDQGASAGPLPRERPEAVKPAQVIGSFDLDRCTAIIEAAGAEELMPRFRNLARGDIREKRPGDLVTVADEACERRLAEALTELLPGSAVVGEEGVAADASTLDRIAEDRPVWIIDPLDGTYNFAHGRDRFVIIVALAYRGEAIAGWIHDPVRQVTAATVTGEGAWIGKRRLRAGAGGPLSGLTGSFTVPRVEGWRRDATLRLARVLKSHRGIDCAGAEYVAVADGQPRVVLFRALKPWDHAAGELMFREAGGYGALIDGRRYAPTMRDGTLLLAPNETVWREAVRLVMPGSEPAPV